MDIESNEIRQSIYSVHLKNIHINWSQTGCIVDFSKLEERTAQFGSHLRNYLNSLGLMKKFQIVHRYERETGAWLDVIATFSNNVFDDFGNEVDEIRKAIRSKMSAHHKGVMELSMLEPQSSPLEDLRQIRKLMTCLDSIPTDSADFSFGNAGSLTLQRTNKIVKKIVDENGECREVVGRIMDCNDRSQTVTLYKLRNMIGSVCLELENDDFRDDILDAQKGRELVRAWYAPTKNLLNPHAVERSGILKSVERIGSDNLF